MTVVRTSITVASGALTLMGVLAAVYALYRWAIYALVWTTAWDLTTALTWTIIAALFFAPVWVLDRVSGSE